MFISYTHYKNSILATLIDAFGSFCYAMIALAVVLGAVRFVQDPAVISGISAGDIIGVILSATMMILIGTGAKRLARRIALKKAQRKKK